MRDIVLVGSGNVAWHLAHALGDRLAAVASRTREHAEALARQCSVPQAVALEEVAALQPRFVIFSLADQGLDEAVARVGAIPGEPVCVHTSGTMPMECLRPVSPRYGVLYPLQTFTAGSPVNMREVPFFTEAVDVATLAEIDALAHTLSDSVYHADAAARKVLHVAGVFTSNFPNALLEIVEQLLARENYPLSTIRPLLEATMAKAFARGPHAAQTGPARRGDKAVIAAHLDTLSGAERAIYAAVSDYILASHGHGAMDNSSLTQLSGTENII
ncbi:MAG: DUF2520 domain-containing protein [Muribaculaceae bacterium]|nr:DUF2520 domain-containing protein [Muribaculaceae bacterium]